MPSTSPTDDSTYSEDQDGKQTCASDKPRKKTRPRAKLRPLGPVHLEYEYTLARQGYSVAIATAAHELQGFSVPARSEPMKAKRPTKDCMLALKQHPLVRRTAKALDEADRALEEALGRGELWENTPIPAYCNWSSPHLQAEYEGAYIEPADVVKKKARRAKARVGLPDQAKACTRSRRRQTPNVRKRERSNSEEMGTTGTGQPDSNSAESSSRSTPMRNLLERERRTRSRSLVSSPPRTTNNSKRSSVDAPEKKTRGRPKTATSQITGALVDIETPAMPTQSSDVGSSLMRFRLDPPVQPGPPAAPLVPRKRGRPRKLPDAPPVPTMDQIPKLAIDAMAAQDPEKRYSKRRKIASSK